MKFVRRYVQRLVPARTPRAPRSGSLFHLLAKLLYTGRNDAALAEAVARWRLEHIGKAREHSDRVRSLLGFSDASIVDSMEESCDEIARDTMALIEYYRDNYLARELDAFEVIFAEQRFSVPLTTRDDRRHPVWRLDGKWDLVLRSRSTGRVKIRDLKTTIRKPQDFATLAELDTQGIGYQYGGLWLHSVSQGQSPEAILPDLPFWPEGLESPCGFELEVIRRKVPKEPPVLKKGGLSKAQNIDTTAALYRQAIKRYGLDPVDYADVLDRLDTAGESAWRFKSMNPIGEPEIRRWAEETRMCLEDLRYLELHPERAYRADPMTCQGQYGRRCEYHSLCYDNEEYALSNYIEEAPNNELWSD